MNDKTKSAPAPVPNGAATRPRQQTPSPQSARSALQQSLDLRW